MRKLLGLVIAIPIAVLFIFILNIMLYITVPFYREALNGAVSSQDIPVVEASKTQVIYLDEKSQEVKENDEVPIVFHGVKKEETSEKSEEKLIVDKTYYEDCGTGKGYWVITYDDGSTEIQ